MDILELIKNRTTTKRFNNKPIPIKLINKVIDAGVWGPSILGLQPWKFIVIVNRNVIKEFSNIIKNKSEEINVASNIVYSVANVISNAQVVIAVYNTKIASKRINKVGKVYGEIVKTAEVEAISAAIQNMILIAESLGIGTCWLDIPLICEDRINKFLNVDDQLIAVLGLGYPVRGGLRAPRRKIKETVIYIK